MEKKTLITPKASSYGLPNLWHYREFFYFLVWRDIKVRYKQTIMGILWVMLQPFITMVVFSFLFGSIAKIQSNGIPYPIFVFTGLIFWNLFSRSIVSAADSIVTNRNLVSKIYFPRLILPMASTVVNLIDFFFAFLILILLMIYFQFLPQPTNLIIIPLALALILMLSIGVGSLVAALNVRYRDVRFIVSYALQIFLFLTPVVYPAKLAGKYKFIFRLNPMSGIIEFLRHYLFGTNSFDYIAISISILLSITLFFLGILFFQNNEKDFADIV